MKSPFFVFAITGSVLVSASAFAEPRLMQMLDDTQLKQTRVDYFTELDLTDNQDENKDKALERDLAKDKGMSADVAPAVLSETPQIHRQGVTINAVAR